MAQFWLVNHNCTVVCGPNKISMHSKWRESNEESYLSFIIPLATMRLWVILGKLLQKAIFANFWLVNCNCSIIIGPNVNSKHTNWRYLNAESCLTFIIPLAVVWFEEFLENCFKRPFWQFLWLVNCNCSIIIGLNEKTKHSNWRYL